MKDNIFKCFGISKNDAKALLLPIIEDNQGVYITIEGELLLTDVSLHADDNNMAFYEISRFVFEKLANYIYAESDIPLEETVFQLLKMHNLTFATTESITGGTIASKFIKKNNGASSVLLEGTVVYTNEAKMRRLGVSKQILDTYTAVSVQTAYDMAKGALKESGADVVIATTGYATSNIPNTDDGLVFIAIGDKNRIDVYKNRFSGTREEIIETVASATFFYLIKKLRKNDFILDKNTI